MHAAEDVLRWLREPTNPSVRYRALTGLLGQPETDAEVRSTRAQLMEHDATPALLDHPRSLPLHDERPYWKYDGLYWQLIALGQFLADGKDPRIAAAIDFVPEHRRWVQKRRWQCWTTNLLGAPTLLGYTDHPIVIEETEALARRIIDEDGINAILPAARLCGRLQEEASTFSEVPGRESLRSRPTPSRSSRGLMRRSSSTVRTISLKHIDRTSSSSWRLYTKRSRCSCASWNDGGYPFSLSPPPQHSRSEQEQLPSSQLHSLTTFSSSPQSLHT